jgi:hypothetical protein
MQYLRKQSLPGQALLILALLSSCAKQQTLSDTQKQQILDTLDSSGRGYNAALLTTGSPSRVAFSFARLVSLSGKRIDTSQPSLRQMSNFLRDKIKARDCRVRLISPTSYSIEAVQGIKRTFALLRVWGEKDCPIGLDFRITTLLEPAIGRFAISYDYSYSTSDPSYAQLNDVDAVELHGGVSTNGLGTSAVRTETDLKGSIHSQSLGTVQISAFGKLDGPDLDVLTGNTIWSYSYSDFEADFYKKYQDGKISYSINDEDISSSDFDQYFSLGGDPFLYSSNSSLVH